MVRRALKIIKRPAYGIVAPTGQVIAEANTLKQARAVKKQLAPPPRAPKKPKAKAPGGRRKAVKVYPDMQPVMVGS